MNTTPTVSLRASVHFASASNEWATPQDFFDAQHAIHKFTLDVCATPENAKCPRYYTKADDGLKQSWAGERCWMNPPYGRAIGGWMRKAYEESLRGALVVCLVPARTDTAWWHNYAAKGDVAFIRGRLKFGDGKNSAPFPSALVVLKAQTGSAALAKAVWSAAKSYDLLYEDVIGCCSILVSSVAKNSGEPVEYLLSELQRRMPPTPNTKGQP